MGNVGSDYTWQGLAGMQNGGGLISFEISVAVHAEYAEGADIYGEHGHIRLRTHFPFFKRASDIAVHIEASGVSLVPHFGDTDAYKLQAEAFARAIIEDRPTDPSPEDGVAAVRWIAAVAESSMHGGREVVL